MNGYRWIRTKKDAVQFISGYRDVRTAAKQKEYMKLSMAQLMGIVLDVKRMHERRKVV